MALLKIFNFYPHTNIHALIALESNSLISLILNIVFIQLNGMRAVSPPTITALVGVLSKWECDAKLRTVILQCFAKMVIVLHRSNAVERQIDMLTVFQMYLDMILTLLKTRQFEHRPFEEHFDLESADYSVDLNALNGAIENITCTLSDSQSRLQICTIIIEANYLATLVNIPKRVQKWEFDKQKLATSIVRTIATLRKTSTVVVEILCNTPLITTLFDGIRSFGKPTRPLIEQCIELAYDTEKKEIIFAQIITFLVEWIKEMQENEQIYVAETMLQICSQNLSWYIDHVFILKSH